MAFVGSSVNPDPDMEYKFRTLDGRVVAGSIPEFSPAGVRRFMRTIRRAQEITPTSLWAHDGTKWALTQDATVGRRVRDFTDDEDASWQQQQQDEAAALLADVCQGHPAVTDLSAMTWTDLLGFQAEVIRLMGRTKSTGDAGSTDRRTDGTSSAAVAGQGSAPLPG